MPVAVSRTQIVFFMKILSLGDTRVLFFRQEFFDRKRKIKFRFILVAFARDF